MVPSRLGDSSPLDLATGLQLARLQRAPSGPEEDTSAPVTGLQLHQSSKTNAPALVPSCVCDSGKGFGGNSSTTSVRPHHGGRLLRTKRFVLGKL